jgi:hypothetical protein
VVCYFHHHLIHAGRVTLRGRAPLALEWTPPQLMREVLERRRNNPAMWVGELDIHVPPVREQVDLPFSSVF